MILIVIGIAIFTLHEIGDDINTSVQADTDINTQAKTYINKTMTNYGNFWDDAFLLMFVLFWVGALAGVFLIDTHPFFLIISIVVLVFLLSAVMLIGNSFEEYVSDDNLIAYIPEYPAMYWVLSHLIIVTLAVSGSLLLTLYAKYEYF